MSLRIRPYETTDHARVLDICIAAFTPVYEGFDAALGQEIFHLRFQDWKEQYAKDIAAIPSTTVTTRVYVAEYAGTVTGFIFTIMDAERKTGELGLNAVDPNAQSQGIGKAMYEFALATSRSVEPKSHMWEPAATPPMLPHELLMKRNDKSAVLYAW